MKNKAMRELLCLFLYVAEEASPCFTLAVEAFSLFLHRHGLRRSFRDLVNQHFIEARKRGDRFSRTTEKGIRLAFGGRNPAEFWSRPWNGCWTLVSFDIPKGKNHTRQRMLREFRGRRYGMIHESLWLTPDPVPQPAFRFNKAEHPVRLRSYQLHGDFGGITPDDIYHAWNFGKVGRNYQTYIDFAEQGVAHDRDRSSSPAGLKEWVLLERTLWNAACDLDPLLPDALLPRDYLGKAAWESRMRVIGAFMENYLNTECQQVTGPEGSFFELVGACPG